MSEKNKLKVLNLENEIKPDDTKTISLVCSQVGLDEETIKRLAQKSSALRKVIFQISIADNQTAN